MSRDNLNPSRRGLVFFSLLTSQFIYCFHLAGTDLGLRITGGHSIPNCMEVTACIERIDTHHRNYNILKNAVEEGDEVLEVGGVSLRGKSALFVQNLMNSIEDEFEIVIRRYIKSFNHTIIMINFLLVNISNHLYHHQLKFINLKKLHQII